MFTSLSGLLISELSLHTISGQHVRIQGHCEICAETPVLTLSPGVPGRVHSSTADLCAATNCRQTQQTLAEDERTKSRRHSFVSRLFLMSYIISCHQGVGL